MKNQLLIIALLLNALMGFSQGIEFERGSWKEVLEKAKLTNKPIFVDVYTTWCGPCKKMTADIFPLANVGKEYNTNFVCYKIDAEKGEGIDFAKKYEVRSYPTYVFIKPDGTLFSRAVGSMDAKSFIAVSKSAISDLNDPKSITEWEKEYLEKKNDPAFLLEYMNKRAKMGKANTQLFDEYLTILPVEKRASDKIVEIYFKEIRNIKLKSVAYKNLNENQKLLLPKLGGYVNMIKSSAIESSFREACKNKDEQLLQEVISANEELPKTPQSKSKEEFLMNYYKNTNDLDKYVSAATLFAQTNLMTVSTDSITKLDKKALELFELRNTQNKEMKIDSAQLVQIRAYLATASRNKYSQALNELAWGFFEKVTNKQALENALIWSKQSLEINKENHMYLDTYANLLYKLGKNEDAILKITEAVNLAKTAKSETKGYEETLKKMKAGEKTWK